jgi:hypothetical protein
MGIALLSSAPSTRDHRLSFTQAPLATRHFVSSKVELLCSYLANPRDARSQRSVDSFQYVTCVRRSISRAHRVVLPRVSYAQLRHFATSLPEALPPLYPDTRNAEIPNSSLPLIATRDFGTFGTEVSTSYPSICRNAEISTRRQRGSHNGTSHLFEFQTSRLRES